MNTISNERLEEIAEEDNGSDVLFESSVLARELLALRKEREKAEPVPQLENLEHFIAFWRKVQSGAMSPSKNEINYTVWFLEKLADIAAPPAPVANGAWSGWCCQYPGKFPRLYGAKEIAEVNCDPANGDRLFKVVEVSPAQAAPRVDAEPVAWRYRYVKTVLRATFTGEWVYVEDFELCHNGKFYEVQPLYDVPSAPVMPDEAQITDRMFDALSADEAEQACYWINTWRAAMLK